MLIRSEKRLTPTAVNMMTIKGEDDYYYYIHRQLYDQAVILEDSYGTNPTGLRLMISGAHTKPCADFFFSNAPKPLNILGYFLELIDSEEDFGEDMEMMCGAIHVMSMCLNFRNLLKIESRVRASVRFSLSIKEEYQLPWQRFFSETYEYQASIPDRLAERVALPEETESEPEDEDEFDWDAPIDFDSIIVEEDQEEEVQQPKQSEPTTENIVSQDKGVRAIFASW